MIDEKLEDLIQRGSDGELRPEERETLRELLESSPEARRLSDRLNELARSLNAIATTEVPADLRAGILRKLDAGEAEQAENVAPPIRPLQPRRPRWMPFELRPFGAGLAAGVALAALVLGVSSKIQPDASSVVGTMMPPEEAEAWKKHGRLPLEADRTSGWAEVRSHEGALLLTLELDAPEETEVVVELDPPTWGLISFERSTSGGAVQIGPDRMHWKHTGAGTYRLHWQRKKEDEVSPSLRLALRTGETWHEHVLPTAG